MYTFLGGILLLIVGYFTYGKLVEKIFGVKEGRTTPAYTNQDNVDYLPMGTKRNSLIQLLNIAGVGPIFGPIMGAFMGLSPSSGLSSAVFSPVLFTIT